MVTIITLADWHQNSPVIVAAVLCGVWFPIASLFLLEVIDFLYTGNFLPVGLRVCVHGELFNPVLTHPMSK